MQRRIEETNDYRQTVHSAEHAKEVTSLSLQKIVAGLFANSFVIVEDEGLNDLLTFAKEHMLSAAQANTLSAEITCELSIFWVVSVCANTHGAELVCPFKDGVKIASKFGLNKLNSTQNNNTGSTVKRDNVAFLDYDVGAGNRSLFCLGVNLECVNAANTGSTHATSDNSCMRSLAAMGGKNAFSSNHASKIVGSGFPTNQNGLATFLSSLYGIVGGEYSFTNSSTRRSVEALGNYIVVSLGIELRMQQLIELLRVYALYSFFLGDKAFLLHLDCDVQSCSSSTLTNTGLKHPKLTLFNGELDVAHITEMVFEDGEYLFELTTSLFKARSFLELCNGAGVTNTGNNVFALCVNKVVAVEFLFAICGVTRKSNARSRSVALVAENHGLNVYGST